MTRQISIHKLEALKLIAGLHETQELSKLAICKSKVLSLEREISQIRNHVYPHETIAELKQVEAWNKWRNQEVFRLIGVLAILKAELEEATKAAGKAVAENSVLTELTIAATKEQSRKELGRADEKSFDASLYLLANNIGN